MRLTSWRSGLAASLRCWRARAAALRSSRLLPAAAGAAEVCAAARRRRDIGGRLSRGLDPGCRRFLARGLRRAPSIPRAASAGSRRGRRRRARCAPRPTSQNSSHTARSSARSWLTSITVPSNSLSAIARASRVARSRWLVGSSSSSRLGRCQTIMASTSRAFSPPLMVPTACWTISPVKWKLPRKLRRSCSRADGAGQSRASRNMCSSGVSSGAQHVEFLLREVADGQALALGDRAGRAAAASRAIVLTSVDLPWPLAPRMPMRWPARTERLTPPRMSLGRAPSTDSRRPRRLIASIGLGRLAGSLNSKVKSALGQHRRDLLHPLQRLDAALRLLGLAGLGLEAVDELLQVGDLVLLLREARLLQLQLLRAHLLERAVVAAVARELLARRCAG